MNHGQRAFLISHYNVRQLRSGDEMEQFDCGDCDLNDFIVHDAEAYSAAKLAVTYVMYAKANAKHVAAYFSLANDRVSLIDFESKTEFNRFRRHRFPNEKRLKSYPAVKLCRLGVDLADRKLSIGTFILNFIKSYFTRDNKTGCQFITVDAYATAIPFYEKNGFVPLCKTDANDTTRLLYFDLNDIDE